MTIEELKDNVVSLQKDLNEKFAGTIECLQKELNEVSTSTIEYLKKELNEKLENAIETLKKATKTIYKPDANERYYSVDGYGSVFTTTFNTNSMHDGRRIAIGNYYKTSEEANFEANCEKYTRLYRKFVQEHDTKQFDGGNEKQVKWYMCYDDTIHTITSNWRKYYASADVYASNKEVLEEAINFIGEDNFKKYVLRIDK